MRYFKKDIKLVVALLVLSVVFYVLNYALFRRGEDILFCFIEDVAFLFVQVLLVTLIIQSILDQRDKTARLNPFDRSASAVIRE